MKSMSEATTQLNAGPEMDRLVAIQVMGLPERTLDDSCPNCDGEMRNCGARARCFNCDEWIHSPYREYSTDIEQAWLVIEKLLPDFEPGIFHDSRWGCVFRRRGTENRYMAMCQIPADHDDAPLAICRAALLAAAAGGAGAKANG